jgi:Bifunctional DNA primase/polymerase, N-terminal/AAA domain/Primase C terminal 2 (PriCT-2)
MPLDAAPSADSSPLEVALFYARAGIPVFPCNPLNKRPLTRHGFKDATTNETVITGWFAQWPNALVAAPCGPLSGLVVVDLDRKDPTVADGVATWKQWLRTNGKVKTRQHQTPTNKGGHEVFIWEQGCGSIPLGVLGPGVEVKGEGGYVIVPPGRLDGAGGGTWKLTQACAPVAMPRWLQQMILSHCNARRDREAPRPVQVNQSAEAAAVAIPLWEPHELAEIRVVLARIPADDYWVWFKVGAALYHEFDDEIGYELYREWSATSPKHIEWQCRRKWRDCAQVTSIGIGTIYHLAQELGGADEDVIGVAEGLAPEQKVFNLEGQPVDDHGVPLVPLRAEDWLRRVLPPPVFLCGKWLTTTSRTLVTAETGIGKSMWAIGLWAAMAAAKPFLHWQCTEPRKVLLIDGEMARRVTKQRMADELARLGCVPEGAYLLSHEDLDDWAPLNTKEGQKLIERQIKLIGHVDCIIFDNIMSLISGDQKEEEGWTAILPWLRRLTKYNIAQVWLHHTGHDLSRSYGTKTREWQMTNYIHFTKTEETEGLNFSLSFKKKREWTPDTRQDFVDTHVKLEDGVWVWSVPETNVLRPLAPSILPFYEALCLATAQSGLVHEGYPAAQQEAWKAVCQERGILPNRQTFTNYRAKLINTGWIACSENLGLAWTIGPNNRTME